jgi:hypothetical protein
MNWRHYAILFVIGLSVPFAVSRFQSLPGYMDADYYFAGGLQLAKGQGFTEPYLWNYLDDPAGLPHPSHTYWMPLASIVSAFGMWITGQSTYPAGRLSFILLSACVPLLTATLAFHVSRQVRLALTSGFLSIFSLYYAPFMPVPDNYAIFMLLGGAFLLLAPFKQRWIPIALGALAGLMTLARSDGLLWLGLAGLTVMWKSVYKGEERKSTFTEWLRLIVPAGLLVIVGYLLVMGPWHIRNLNLFGSLLTPGGGRLLWVQNYNETFIYPASELSRESFLQAGWGLALRNRVDAFITNLGTTIGVQGVVFLVPFVLIGLWQLRHDLRSRIVVTGWLILFLVMTFVFPFAGWRGSFFHAGAAFQPYWWALAPIGLDIVIAWVRKRGYFTDSKAPVFFQIVFVLVALIVTVYLVNIRVISNGWAKDDIIYQSVEELLVENGAEPGEVVIVLNPPGYYVRTGRPAIVIPFGNQATLLTVAKRYNAAYVVIEENSKFTDIKHLYENPRENPAFIYLGEVDEAKLYRIELAD